MASVSFLDLGNTGALFAIILAVGFVVGKMGFLSKATQTGLTNIVIYVTLPCTIINSFQVSYDPALIRNLGLTLFVAVCSQAIGQAASVIFFRKQPHEQRSVLRYGMIVCNSGFFGLPVLYAVFGSLALPYGAIYLIPQRFAMWLLGVPLFDKDSQKKKSAVAKTFVHPAMIAVYVGLALMIVQKSLPTAINTPVVALASCTMPLAMMLVGSILVDIKPSMLLDKNIYFYCLIRSALIPALVFLLCLLLGFGGTVLHVSVLMAGMPAAVTTSLLALRYGADERLGSALIVISTITFFIMLPVWLAIFPLVP